MTIPQIAEQSTIKDALARLSRFEAWITERQIELCSIPAPSFEEEKRAEWFRRQFMRLKLEGVRIDSEGNLLAEIPGTAPNSARKIVAVTAHLDTVFPRTTEVVIKREKGVLYGPGVSDNGAGLSALLAIARALRESDVELPHTLMFVANVGEEGQGDLRGMKHFLSEAAFRDRLRAVLVVDGPGAEHVVTQGLGSLRFEAIVEGPGGHSWRDFGTVNPILALASLAGKIGAMKLPKDPRTTCSVSDIHGGTSVNSIPVKASMKIDIRSTSGSQMTKLAESVREIAAAAVKEEMRRAEHGSLSMSFNGIGHRPAAALPKDAQILEVIRQVDRHLGISTRLEQSSTDANVPFSLGVEAVCVGAGGNGAGMHSASEWYDPADRVLALKRILLTAAALCS